MVEVVDACPNELPDWIVDEAVTARLERLQAGPKPRVVQLPKGWSW